MLFYHTINDLLRQNLELLMNTREFESFRLVGGTSLSLQPGHRISVDIDLFSDAPYDSIDFGVIDAFLENQFPYCNHLAKLKPALGKAYVIGKDLDHAVKLDVFYTDPFIHPPLEIDGLRLASIEDIIAMKIDVVKRGGRKKDFWDLHELLSTYTVKDMLKLHQQRYPYIHEPDVIIRNFTDFTLADDDFDPVCLKGKYWEFIKEDMEDAVANYRTKGHD